MSAVLPTCNPATLPDTPSATSSLALEGGASPSDLPDGPTLDLFGQVRVPASRSQPPAKAKAGPTIATSGLRGSGSSASVALSTSLANRLRLRLDMAGLTLFRQTWKAKATLSGRMYWEHTASAPRTGDNDCGSWPTPNLSDDNNSRCANPLEYSTHRLSRPNACSQLADTAQALVLTARPSPKVSNTNGAGAHGEGGADLQTVALTSSWATPTTRDHKDGTGQSCQNVPVNALLGRQAHLSSWPTPMAGTPSTESYNAAGSTDYERKVDALMGMRESVNSPKLGAWPTARAEDSSPYAAKNYPPGPTSSGSPAETASPGQLNPAFSRWLQGYPVAWCQAAIRVSRRPKPRRKRG